MTCVKPIPNQLRTSWRACGRSTPGRVTPPGRERAQHRPPDPDTPPSNRGLSVHPDAGTAYRPSTPWNRYGVTHPLTATPMSVRPGTVATSACECPASTAATARRRRSSCASRESRRASRPKRRYIPTITVSLDCGSISTADPLTVTASGDRLITPGAIAASQGDDRDDQTDDKEDCHTTGRPQQRAPR